MRFGLILAEVGQGFRRNLSMVVSVILVTFVSLTFFGAAILLQLQIGQMKGYWYDRAEVTIYMCIDFSTAANCAGTASDDAQIASVQAQLSGKTLEPYVEEIIFESAEEAYQNFLVMFAGDPVAEISSVDFFGPDFRVKLVDPDQSDVIIDSVSGMPGVEEVRDQRALLQPIFSGMNAASYTAVGVAALMLIAAVLLISTTIRLSAFSRRRELSIMRLVGASNRFIQTPFVLEGVIAAFIGAALASGAVLVIVEVFVGGYLAETIVDYSFIGVQDALVVIPILVGVGVVLAAFAALGAIRRYLRA